MVILAETAQRMKLGHERRLPNVSIVVIGLNEGRHLKGCIDSIRSLNYPAELIEILYVDTGSTDGSQEIAKNSGVRVIEERSWYPTPGLARNRGWRESSSEIVHFIDGDCTIDPLYLVHAAEILVTGEMSCVFGNLQERHMQNNFISWALSFPWSSRKPGRADAPAAGGTFLREALQAVGGYNSNLLRAEETEIGFRLNLLGYRTSFLDIPMGTHDFAITNPVSLLRRYFGIGIHFGRVLDLPRKASYAEEQQLAFRQLVQAVGILPLFALLIALGRLSAVLVFALCIGLYVPLRYWGGPELRAQRIAYFALQYLFKPVVWIGMASYWLRRLFSRIAL